MVFLSIVTPVYRTGAMLEELVARISVAAGSFTDSYEIVLVEDGSPDASWDQVVALATKHAFVRGIKLSRNFGQHAAITAGLEQSKGEWIVVMDSDLQDVPEEIPRLYQLATQGYAIVAAKRMEKAHSFFRRFASKVFSYLLTWLSGLSADYTIANFGIYSRQVINEVISMPEMHKFFPMSINWVGFRRTTLEYKHGERGEGNSGYNLKKLLRMAMNITLAYSDKPLRYVVRLGFIISLVSFIYGIIVLWRYFTGHISVLGYTSLIVSIWFLSGVILFTLGVVGLYVGKTFEEAKRRPVYIVEKKINAVA